MEENRLYQYRRDFDNFEIAYYAMLNIVNTTSNTMREIILNLPINKRRKIGALFNAYPYLEGKTNETPFLFDNTNLPDLKLPPTLYHVTGCGAITSLMRNESLQPSVEWDVYNLRSDKGIGPLLQHFLLRAMRINVSGLPLFLFSGAKIDAEQVWSFERQAGTCVNRIVAENFFGPSTLIMRILRSKKNGDIKSEEYGKLSNDFLEQMYNTFFLREGWLEEVRAWLKSKKQLSGFFEQAIVNGKIDLEDIAHLHPVEDKPNLDFVAAPAAILELDPNKLTDACTIGPFIVLPGGQRNIREIFPTPIIPPEAVKRVFVKNPKLYSSLPFEVCSFSQVPCNKWLGDTPYTNGMSPDMDNPLCALRYEEDDPITIEELLRKRLVAPLRPLDPRDVLRECPNSLPNSLRYWEDAHELPYMPGVLDLEFLKSLWFRFGSAEVEYKLPLIEK